MMACARPSRSGSITVGHRVKRPNGFHLLQSAQYFIRVVKRNIILSKSSLTTSFQERFSLRLNRRWTGTLNKSSMNGGVCERLKRQKRGRVCVFVQISQRVRERPPCYIILRFHAVFLGSVEGARECVWCSLSSVPAG